MTRKRGIRGGKDRYGSPTVNPPKPQGIDPWSGFKRPLDEFVPQWDGQIVWRETRDIRNPQDFVRGVKDDQSLPFARPETPDSFIAENLAWEDGAFMSVEGATGNLIYSQGTDPQDTL